MHAALCRTGELGSTPEPVNVVRLTSPQKRISNYIINEKLAEASAAAAAAMLKTFSQDTNDTPTIVRMQRSTPLHVTCTDPSNVTPNDDIPTIVGMQYPSIRTPRNRQNADRLSADTPGMQNADRPSCTKANYNITSHWVTSTNTVVTWYYLCIMCVLCLLCFIPYTSDMTMLVIMMCTKPPGVFFFMFCSWVMLVCVICLYKTLRIEEPSPPPWAATCMWLACTYVCATAVVTLLHSTNIMVYVCIFFTCGLCSCIMPLMDGDPGHHMTLLYFENGAPSGTKFPMTIWAVLLAVCFWGCTLNILGATVGSYEWLSQPICMVVGMWFILFMMLSIITFYPATNQSPVARTTTAIFMWTSCIFICLCVLVSIHTNAPPALYFLLLALGCVYVLVLRHLDECQRIVKFCACRCLIFTCCCLCFYLGIKGMVVAG